MVLSPSMNADLMVGIPRAVGDAQTLLYAKEFVLTFCSHRWWGYKHFGHKCRHAVSTGLFSCGHLQAIQFFILLAQTGHPSSCHHLMPGCKPLYQEPPLWNFHNI